MSREKDRFRIDIMGLSEVRWNTAGRIMLASGHTLLLSGPKDEDDHLHKKESLLLTKTAHKSLLEW